MGSGLRRQPAKIRQHPVCWLLASVVLLVACGGEDSGVGVETTPAPTMTPVTMPSATPHATPEPTPDERDLPEAVRHVREVAANDAGIDPQHVAILDFEEVVWPSTALGCPTPGMFYAQVLTPGFRVSVEVDGSTRRYHTDSGTTVVRCDQ
jgi:hypothetical protein